MTGRNAKGGRVIKLWVQLPLVIIAIGVFSLTALAANQPQNNHSPVPQITDQADFELVSSRWRGENYRRVFFHFPFPDFGSFAHVI